MMVFLPRWQPGSLRSDEPHAAAGCGLRVIRAMLMGAVAANVGRLDRAP